MEQNFVRRSEVSRTFGETKLRTTFFGINLHSIFRYGHSRHSTNIRWNNSSYDLSVQTHLTIHKNSVEQIFVRSFGINTHEVPFGGTDLRLLIRYECSWLYAYSEESYHHNSIIGGPTRSLSLIRREPPCANVSKSKCEQIDTIICKNIKVIWLNGCIDGLKEQGCILAPTYSPPLNLSQRNVGYH